jgi:uncharacterized membrane protein
MKRPDAIPTILVLASWALAAYYWPHLPATMPVHWGVHGEPNGWMPRLAGTLVGPLLATSMALLFGYVTRKASSPEVQGALMALGAGFGCFITALVLDTAARPDQHLDVRLIWGGLGLMFIVMGNYLPKVRRNPFIGIRTRWTLGNEEVWYRTHRVSGRLMVACGLVVAAASQLPPLVAVAVVLGTVTAMAATTTWYSWWLHKNLDTSPE